MQRRSTLSALIASAIALAMTGLACQSHDWETGGAPGLRQEMRRLLTYENDATFMKEFWGSLEQAGFKVLFKEGSSVMVGGCMIKLPAHPTGAFQITGSDEQEHPVDSWPFVRYLTAGSVSETPPAPDQLSETPVLAGMSNGRIVVVRLGKDTLSLIDPR